MKHVCDLITEKQPVLVQARKSICLQIVKTTLVVGHNVLGIVVVGSGYVCLPASALHPFLRRRQKITFAQQDICTTIRHAIILVEFQFVPDNRVFPVLTV